MSTYHHRYNSVIFLFSMLVLSACKTGSETQEINFSQNYTIGGNVSGLEGSGLKLLNNDTDEITITGNGDFTFSTSSSKGSEYNVTVASQPSSPNQQCSVSHGSGTINESNITNIAVECNSSAAQYSIGGTVSGLSGSGLSIALNSEESLEIYNDGSFTFSQTLTTANTYSVAITSHPSEPAQVCEINNASGSISNEDITNISINCIQHNVNLSWNENHESDLHGYYIYYGEHVDELNNKIFVQSSNNKLTFTPSRSGDHYFSISALDASGNESTLSTAVFVEVY